MLHRQAAGLLSVAETIAMTVVPELNPPTPDDHFRRNSGGGAGRRGPVHRGRHADPAGVGLRLARPPRQPRLAGAGHPVPEEFTNLFALRFRQELSPGLLVNPEGPELTLRYTPANPGFGGQRVSILTGLPDITTHVAGVNRLHALAERIQDELDPYSRLLGRKPEARGTEEAFALLPPA